MIIKDSKIKTKKQELVRELISKTSNLISLGNSVNLASGWGKTKLMWPILTLKDCFEIIECFIRDGYRGIWKRFRGGRDFVYGRAVPVGLKGWQRGKDGSILFNDEKRKELLVKICNAISEYLRKNSFKEYFKKYMEKRTIEMTRRVKAGNGTVSFMDINFFYYVDARKAYYSFFNSLNRKWEEAVNNRIIE